MNITCGNVEIYQDELPTFLKNNILWLYITMSEFFGVKICQSRSHLMNELIYYWQCKIFISNTIFSYILTIDELHQGVEQSSIGCPIIFETDYIRMTNILQGVKLIYCRLRANSFLEYFDGKHSSWLKGMESLKDL